jgi:hypothetical protein
MDMFKANSPLQEMVTVEACIIEHSKQLEYERELMTQFQGDDMSFSGGSNQSIEE